MIHQLKRLVRDVCANYDKAGPGKIKNWCWPRGKTCKFFGDIESEPGELERCGYLERSVLSADPGLQLEYSSYFKAGKALPMPAPKQPAQKLATVRLRCKCGKTFVRCSGRQILCADCQKSRRRQKKREAQRQARQTMVGVDT